ncbi:MAG: MFS transporter [Amaricoccus sp.]|uniref:MFS transporter n=1 Tax=Amaricoccus sp. TaxID=1872485 RepID=UPI0039E45AB6
MLTVLASSWALLFGILLLLVGNGLQGTLLGVRGGIEGFDASTMAWVMSAYYVGFLVGSRRATAMIARVGHVRVFAALASLISAAFLIYAVAPNPWVWIAMRALVGFAFSGVYVVAESWLNDAATNETRGKALSLYMVVQMLGIISAQFLLNLANPAGYTLFVAMSVLVSLGVTPILLTASSAPAYRTTQPMSLGALFRISPLGCVGTFLLGGVYAAIFGMASVYGTVAGLSVAQISAFVAAIYVGGLAFQVPVGWLSDRMDRRKLILALTLGGATVTLGGAALADNYTVVLILGFVIGGVANPLYSLIIAYTNDFLAPPDMAAASGGLLFINGTGAMLGPLVIGLLLTRFGGWGFFGYVGGLFALMGIYAAWRMTRRAAPEETAVAYTAVSPTASPVVLELSREVAVERGDALRATESGSGDAAGDATEPV